MRDDIAGNQRAEPAQVGCELLVFDDVVLREPAYEYLGTDFGGRRGSGAGVHKKFLALGAELVDLQRGALEELRGAEERAVVHGGVLYHCLLGGGAAGQRLEAQ